MTHDKMEVSVVGHPTDDGMKWKVYVKSYGIEAPAGERLERKEPLPHHPPDWAYEFWQDAKKAAEALQEYVDQNINKITGKRAQALARDSEAYGKGKAQEAETLVLE